MALGKENKANSSFSKITIGLASPEVIMSQSSGEVLKPETINYRTHKPERDGLFCERIFGPVKDYECACGKYKRIRYKGIVCDRCGVEVTEKKVRRERIGHINLVVPVAHIWYFRSLPNKIGYLLGIPSKKLDMIIYYERYIVINPGVATRPTGEPVEKMEFLTEEEYLDIVDALPEDNQYLEDNDPNKFVAKMGAEALLMMLQNLNLDDLSYELRDSVSKETSKQRKTEALKRLQIVESFREAQKNRENRPEWMIMKVIPVIPPELRPLVPLDGGRFATSDLNDLYRRVIIRNNRLKRLIEIKAPEVILRNEKRMLQEAVDSLFDNTRKASAVKTESNRALKSLSDSLKGKQGRFRQNLLGKRVDYSARSVIVAGPELKIYECGLPKNMAAELYKPFIIRKLIERGIVKTVKSAKKIIDRRDPIVWDILENVIKGHPVLLNRAPTLHRLSIQAFQPRLIEGKAIQLHPLVCTGFNADFDGDQMAVHLPLGPEAILEAQLLMLSAHNILNPANGSPITVPSQDMVLGLYYMTKERRSTDDEKVLGEGLTFYSPEEVRIAYNEGRLNMQAPIKVRMDVWEDGKTVRKIIDTTAGRVFFNDVVPYKAGYINTVIKKNTLRDIISHVLRCTDIATTSRFLDDVKDMGYKNAFRGGLSFSLADILIPEAKQEILDEANEKVEITTEQYNMGAITNNERYNIIIDAWSAATNRIAEAAMKTLKEDKQGFNSVYMMLDSGARGSKAQISQLTGMRGLMAKPQKSGSGGADIIENPIISNFKEGLSILEFFISTHGARKGLADTALKTADAGYLTRRLVDVAQDVIVTEEDCGTLRGIKVSALKENDVVRETLASRIAGRVSLHDVEDPRDGHIMVHAGEMITDAIAREIDASPIETVEVRSALTCEARHGICAKCYGRNLATMRMVQKGEAVGVIAAQSIGEPGTQLTLRTFHQGGTAGASAAESSIKAKIAGRIEFDDLRTVPAVDGEGNDCQVVMSRTTEMRIIDPKTSLVAFTHNIPYGAHLYVTDKSQVEKGELICSWDPHNAIIMSETAGRIKFEDIEQGQTYQVEIDDQTGFQEKIISEAKGKKLIPTVIITDGRGGEVIKSYNLPVGAHLLVENGDKVKAGDILVKIPRKSAKAGDITGGLPRVTELFEARNPSNPAVVAEIDGVVRLGAIKRGNKEIVITSKSGEEKRYLVKLSHQILVQDNDFVRAGDAISEGSISPEDILRIKGPNEVQEYLVNEVQGVYRMQGVVINDKHFEVIVRQMMRKVLIVDAGDTQFLEGQSVHKRDFVDANDALYGIKVVTDAGDSENLKAGQMVTLRQLKDENSLLKRADKQLVVARDAMPATAEPMLQGITRASLQTRSFISAASFQETTKVLNEAAVAGKEDYLEGLKENVIVGHKIPAGTGLREYDDLIVGSREEYSQMRKDAE